MGTFLSYCFYDSAYLNCKISNLVVYNISSNNCFILVKRNVFCARNMRVKKKLGILWPVTSIRYMIAFNWVEILNSTPLSGYTGVYWYVGKVYDAFLYETREKTSTETEKGFRFIWINYLQYLVAIIFTVMLK